MKVETLADNKFCLKEAQNKQGLIQHSLTNGHVSAYSRLMYKKHREIVGVTLQLICLFGLFFLKNVDSIVGQLLFQCWKLLF